MSPKPGDEDFVAFDPNNQTTQIALLAYRVETLGREKEALERDLEDEREHIKKLDERISTIEKAYGKGAGILIGLGFVGTIGGILLAYGKTIFKPWNG